jgi:predicted dehydrogenase
MTNPIRIGILGTGNIAGRALIAPAQDVPEVTVIAVASGSLRTGELHTTARRLRSAPR